MIPDENEDFAPRTHNLPPNPIELAKANVNEALERFAERKRELIAAANAKQVTDRTSAGDAGDIIAIAGRVWDDIEAARKEITEPYRHAALDGKGVADAFWDPVVEALAGLKRRLDNWGIEEDARIAAQQKEQDAFMAKMHSHDLAMGDKSWTPETQGRADIEYNPQPKPAAPAAAQRGLSLGAPVRPAKRRKIHGDLGATVAPVEVKHYVITDIRALPDIVLNSETVHNAVRAVLKSISRHLGDNIDGVEVTTTTENRIRG